MYVYFNGSGRHLRLGGERLVCVRKHTHARGGLGVCSPRKILQIRSSEIASEATFGPKRHYSYLYVFPWLHDSNLYRRPHAMQWLLLKSPNFWISNTEYYLYWPTELGAGPQRSETRHSCAGISATCCENRDYLAWTMVTLSTCSSVNLWVSNKGGLRCHCHDSGWSWGLCPHALHFVGATAPLPPPPLPGSTTYVFT